MDESGIEATQALDFGDIDDETDDGLGDNEPVAFLNVACQKGFPGKSYPVFEGDNVIGRHEDCSIPIPLKALSREHACIEVKSGSHFIYDKGSRNRTRRNQHFLAASVRYELKNKDKLTFGDVECEYQIGTQAADDDETGSESEFQTAPNDQELEQTVDANSIEESKLPDEEDYESDASSDILEPTQPFAGNTQSMLHHKSLNGHSVLGQNVTIKDTPAPVSRSMRFTVGEMLIPESDTDDEGPSKPPATLALAADSQDDEDEEVKSKLIGAATQAYVCESDVTTDDEADDDRSKKSLLAAPTQAFVQDDDDVSTCSEDSPQKRSLMTAATQAFVADSEDDKTPTRAQMAPTLAYDMDEGIEPTQGYDMEEDEKSLKDDNCKKMMFEPTQAYLGTKSDDVDDDKSETSEEFVLEGDTDGEEEEDRNLLAAPTLAMDDVGLGSEAETQGVSADEPTQIVDCKVDHDDATISVTDDATQVFDEPIPKQKGKNTKAHKTGKTQPMTEAETQVFEDKDKFNVGKKNQGFDNDATQIFDDHKEKALEDTETQIFEDNATQVFDNECKTEPVGRMKKVMDQSSATQVSDDGAAQCFDDKIDSTAANTQIFDEPTQVVEDNIHEKCQLKNEEMATQVFENKHEGGVERETSEDGETFDINAESTLAVTDDADSKSADAKPEEVATQVFDDADGTVNDQTMPVVTGNNKSSSTRGKGRKKNISKVTGDDATQVFDETVAVSDQTVHVDESVVQSKSTRGKGRQKKTDNTSDSTQVFDETLVVSDQTGTVNKLVKGSKLVRGKGRQNKKTEENVADDATQVFDETQAVSDQTVRVDGTVGELKSTKSQSRQKNIKSKITIAKSDDATQIFDETVGVSDQTVALDEMVKQEKPTRGRGKQNNKNKTDDKAAVSDDATQMFDATVEPSDQTVDVNESEPKVTRGRGKKQPEKKKATALKDETSLVSNQTVQITNDQTLAIEEAQNKGIQNAKSVIDATQESTDSITENKTFADEMQESTENITKNKTGTEQSSSRTMKGRTKKDDNISAKLGDTDIPVSTLPLDEPVETRVRSSRQSDISRQTGKTKRGKGGKQITENSSEDENVCEKETGIENENKETKDNKAENETENKEDSDTVNSKTKRKSGRQVKAKKFADEEPDNKHSKGIKGKITSISDKTEEEGNLVKNVRKSGRARSKADTSEVNEEETSGNKVKNTEISEQKSEPLKRAASAVAKRRGRKTPDDQEKTEVAAEPETQAYTDDGLSDKEATQQYGDADDDSTPDLDEIGSEDQTVAPIVVEESGRGRSPLKSALASPRKKSSPSPKKVMFVSQNSETGSESGEPSRSSKRRGNGRQQKNAEPAVAASEQAGDKEADKETITRQSRREDQSEGRVETEADLKDEVVAETKKSSRRGRKSVDTATTVKQTVQKRNTRTSLPTVLEGFKPEISLTKDSAENKESNPETSLKEELTENNESEKPTKSVGRSRSKGKGKLESVKETDVALSTDTNISYSESNVKKSSRLRIKKDEEITESKSDTTTDSTKVEEEPTATRSGRSTRNKETRESLKPDIKTGTGRKRKMGDGDKETEDQPEDDSKQTSIKDVKSKSKKTKIDISEVDISENLPDTEQTDAAGDKNSKKGKGKPKVTKVGKVGKTETVEEETVHPTPVREEVEDSSQTPVRSRRGRGVKVEVNEKTEPENDPKDAEVKENNAKSRGRLKRKESASSSNDSQEGESEETPAKRQRKKNDPSMSTPKLQTKQAGGASTPKGAANKTMDTAVTNSPVLRKTTTEGLKAKVMFTGVVDEQGEKIVKELGGELVSSVMDCTHLVTDQVRRTVKFLCCLSRGVPIVSPQWLSSSKTSAFFVDTVPFLVSDGSSERKYKFRLDHSIEKASREPLFKDFTFHITKSVKPEPPQMKEILNCAGAKVVNTMPHKTSDKLTLVISCPEDKHLCEPAYKAGLPVVTAEFVLTGILRQEVDWNSFKLEKDDSGNRRQSLAAEKKKNK